MKTPSLVTPTAVYFEISQSSMKVLYGSETLELPLERLQNGRLNETCKQRLTSTLRDSFKRKSWQPNLRGACAIGARGVSLRRLTLPLSTKEELQRLLSLQIENEFPLPPEQLSWGYAKVERQMSKDFGAAQQEVVIVAVKKEVLDDYAEVFSASGVSATFTLAALARNALVLNPPDTYSILAIGRSSSEMISLDHGAPSSIRVLAWGEETVETALNPLVSGIDPKWIGQKIYLCGENVRERNYAELLATQMGNGVECDYLPEGDLSAAIAGLKKLSEPGVGFIPLTFQLNDTKRSEYLTRSAAWKWAGLAALLAFALLVFPYIEALLLKASLTKKLSTIQAERNRLVVIDRELNFLQDLKKNQSPYLDTLYLVANAAPGGTRFDSLTMNRRGEVSLKGNMGNAQQVTEFRSKLIGSGFFSTVVVDEQTPGPDRQKLAVRITAQWKPTGRKPITVDPVSKTEKKGSEGKTEIGTRSRSSRMPEASSNSATNTLPSGKTNQ